jgi:serine/threonine protein kinase
MELRSLNILTPKTVLQERYRVVRLIGRGGMGAVYEATDLRLKIPVALKHTLVSSTQFRKAFQREALLLARLRHPTLPVVTDYFVEGEAQFLVMQYMPGPDLAALHTKRGEPFLPETVLDWADQLLEALTYLHDQEPPVIHRDIKPQNLKLAANGAIVLLDFGLAKGAAAQSQVFSSSLFGYTPHYAPLEQIRGGGTNARSDLYALAATLYHLLSDGPPISAMERAEAMINGMPDPLVPLATANPEVPESISAVLMQALAQRADARPASAGELREALARARRDHGLAPTEAEQTTVLAARAQAEDDAFLAQIEQPMFGAPDPTFERVAVQRERSTRRRWWLLAALGAAIVLALGVGIPILRASQEPAPTPAPTIALASPSATPTPTASPTATATATATASATPTITPSPAPSNTPTRTARPAARPRPTPTPSPVPPTEPQTEAPTLAIVPPTVPPTDRPSAPRRQPTSTPTVDTSGTPTDEPTSDSYPGPSTPTVEATIESTTEPSATAPVPTATSQPTTQPPLPTTPTP